MPRLYPQVNIRSTEHYPWAIYRDAMPRENSTMDKYERRRLAVAKLIEEKCDGKGASFAKAISRDASYVTRMLYPEGKAGRKRIGDDMIEIIEGAFDLPRGTIDGIVPRIVYTDPPQAHAAKEPSPADLMAVTDQAAELAKQANRIAAMWMRLSPEKRDEFRAALDEAVSAASIGVKLEPRRSPARKPAQSG